MDQSDSRPQLGVPLRLSLATVPPATRSPQAPVGSPVFRRRPFVREAAHDPGGARSSRITMISMLPSLTGTNLASATVYLSRLTYRSPHDPCLRFGPRVAATPARLGPGLLARLWPDRTLTCKWSSAWHSALPSVVEKEDRSPLVLSHRFTLGASRSSLANCPQSRVVSPRRGPRPNAIASQPGARERSPGAAARPSFRLRSPCLHEPKDYAEVGDSIFRHRNG